LYFESGKFIPGTIQLKDNQQVYIEGGAIVVGNTRQKQEQHQIRGLGILDGSYSRAFMIRLL
jgi:hypothetical protein